MVLKEMFHFPTLAIWKIADALATKYGFPRPLRSAIDRETKSNRMMPIMLCCDAGTLWVDPLYVAYQKCDGKVVYAYVTSAHIFEEMYSYREAAKERSEPVEMPKDIQKQLRFARSHMRVSGSKFWVSDELEEMLPGLRKAAHGWEQKWREAQNRKKKKLKEASV